MLQKFSILVKHSVLSKSWIAISFALILSLLSFEIRAQQDTVRLEEVEILGIKPEISVNTPNPVQQLNIKSLNALPATTVAEAIRNFSGVTVKDFGGIGGLKTVMIRSLGANHTSVFIDGLPSADASTGQIDLGKVALQDVGNIQLSIGMPEFGVTSARMYSTAGLLVITSKDPDFSIRNTIIEPGIRIGSFGVMNPSVGISKKWSNKSSSIIRYNYYLAKGEFPYELHNGSRLSELKRQNSDVESSDLSMRTKILLSDSSLLSVKVSWYYSERGLPGAVIWYNPFSAQRLTNNDLTTGIQYKTNGRKKHEMLVSSGFSYNQLLYKDPNFQNQSGGINNRYSQTEFYISDAVSYKLTNQLSALLTTDFIVTSLKTNAYSIENPDRFTSLTATALRYLSKRTEIRGSVLMTAVKDELENEDHKKYFRLSPSVSFLTTITADRSLKARASFNRSLRMPSFNDLYYTLAGNVNVEPEDASLFDAGLLFNKALNQMTGLNFRIDGFYNLVTNKIVVTPTQNLFIWSTRNIGKVDIRGVEFAGGFVKHLSEKWSMDVSGNYTYQKASDVTDKSSENYGNQVAYIPYETAGVIGTLYYRNLSSGFNILYNGFKYTSGYNIPANVMKSWITTDVTLAWQNLILGHPLKIKLEVLNLFNKQYEVVRGFPMTGRSFNINLNLTI